VSQEKVPMGTAGPLALARKLLDDGSGSPFFVLNSDVICAYPLKDMLDFHKARQAEATLLVTRVDDPSKYGVVVMDDQGMVMRFVEKPKVSPRPRLLPMFSPGSCSIESRLDDSVVSSAGVCGRQDQRGHLRAQPCGAQPH
jgi:NDP-sugar pyrophosphorylase family protein